MNKQETLKANPTKALCLLALLACLQAGCAVFSGREESAEPQTMPPMAADTAPDAFATEQPGPSLAEPVGLVARDFVGALKQLWTVRPEVTTIYLPGDKAADEFVLTITKELILAGYAVRLGDDPALESMLDFRKSSELVNGFTRQLQYDLKVGSVDIRRAYVLDHRGVIKPAGNMFIRGADASAVVLDDSIFREQPGWAKPVDVPVSTASRLPASANPLPDIHSLPPAPAMLTTRRQLSASRNLFDTGVSRFDEHLPAQHIVAEEVLIFQNDSLRIGSVNKKRISRMVDNFRPLTDRFSVIGCSMGPTSLQGGNAALALGRASRVVEALMFAGVDRSRIVDEGCWSGNGKRDGLPSRGVVIALRREGTTVN